MKPCQHPGCTSQLGGCVPMAVESPLSTVLADGTLQPHNRIINVCSICATKMLMPDAVFAGVVGEQLDDWDEWADECDLESFIAGGEYLEEEEPD